MYSSCFLGSCEVRLRLIGGSAATIASGCSGAFTEACCIVCMQMLAYTAIFEERDTEYHVE